MVLLAVQAQLAKLAQAEERAAKSETEAATLRTKVEALESLNPAVGPALVDALAQITSLSNNLASAGF